MDRTPCVYMLASGFHGTLYAGVTSKPLQRIYQHREEMLGGFTAEYGVKRLVWFEVRRALDVQPGIFGKLRRKRRQHAAPEVRVERRIDEGDVKPRARLRVQPGERVGGDDLDHVAAFQPFGYRA